MADEIVAHGITREVHRPNAVLRGMAKHPELCFILLTVFVTFLSNYGSSFKSKPLVIPARIPGPLFPARSSVLDLYLGDLSPLVDMLYQEDLIFVMYYAPWCARSHAVASQFSKAAQFLKGQVRFVAVNCWYPEGLCRKQYKFLLYPVFFAYHRNNDGYRYMGIDRAEFMVKFLEDLLHPLTLLSDINHVKDFVAQHDTVVVGYFNFSSSPQPPGFQQFFYSALRVLEHDPYQPVKFGVVTNPRLAAQCHISKPSGIVHLRINNSTLKFPWPNNITSTNIVRWVFAGRHQMPVRWLVPLGMKSLSLSREINKGRAVIMFHKVSPLSSASQSFSVFKDLSLRYNQCPGNDLAAETTRRWLTLSAQNVLHHAKVLEACRQSRLGKIIPAETFKCCISTVSKCRDCMPKAKLNICEICQHWSGAQGYGHFVCSFDTYNHLQQNSPFIMHLPCNSCQNSVRNYDTSSHTSVCCKRCNESLSHTEFLTPPFYSSIGQNQKAKGRRPTDRYILESLEELPRKLCDRLAFEKSQDVFPSAIIPDFGQSTVPVNFTGQGCRTNNSLTFISMDSQNHWMFAKSMGLDVSQASTSPVIVAVDKEKEEQHILQGTFSKRSTAFFILNFTRNLLRHDLRALPAASEQSCGSSPSMCVNELTSDTLLAVLNQGQDLVLLVYAGWCGFCAAISHVFLHLAHYFHTSPNITFARINGEMNDLPWELTMESYPSIIFFPAYREADSMAFPDSVTPSLPNLVRFVLQHATFTTRLHLVPDVCSVACIQENLELSRQTLRALRSKLRRLRSRWSFIHTSRRGKQFSHYQSALEEIVKGRVDDVRSEIKEVKALIEFLEDDGGKQLDHQMLEKILFERMRQKDLFDGS